MKHSIHRRHTSEFRERYDNLRDLGVVLSDDETFSAHIDQVVKTILKKNPMGPELIPMPWSTAAAQLSLPTIFSIVPYKKWIFYELQHLSG